MGSTEVENEFRDVFCDAAISPSISLDLTRACSDGPL
jgi:hypothetical protein